MSTTVNNSLSDKKIKPLHGVCNAPLLWSDTSMFHYMTEAGIPYSRLHDTGGEFGGGIFVDIDNIFPSLDADETSPSSYDFAFTDHLIKSLVDAGVRPIYRLGCSIENQQRTVKPRRIFPPRDYEKWARICEHIIRHYNYGWADGFEFNIKYWEIWNEPDNQPNPADSPMWLGTKEEFFRLYEVASNHLKSCFPDIKVGGYGSCGFYSVLNTTAAQANSSPRTDYFIEFFEDFLKYISCPEHKSPLDFFSWHSYAGADENAVFAAHARARLDAYGFTHTESILDEWNSDIAVRGTLADASNIGKMLVTMQNSPVDIMAYYDAQWNTPYGGLFSPMTLTPFKAFYVFKAFDTLYRLGTQTAVEGADELGRLRPGELPTLYALRATDGEKIALLLVNTGEALSITRRPGKGMKISLIDEEHNLEPIPTPPVGKSFTLAENAIALLEYK